MDKINYHQLERGLLVDFILTPREVLEAIQGLNLTAAHFENAVYRETFDEMQKANTLDPVKLNAIHIKHGLGDAVDSDQFTVAGVSTLIWDRVETLIKAHNKNELIRKANFVIQNVDTYSDANAMAADLASIARQNYHADASSAARSLDTLDDPIPEEEDPRAIFKNGYLRRGGGLILAAQAGVGKSVISIQAAYSWAIGKPFLGITPVHALKIGIIQSEDDETEMSDFRMNIRKGLIRDGWTQDEIRRAEQNIFWEDKAFLGKAGDDFIATLRTRQMKQHYDLIIINPLQAYFGGDISNNQDASHFFRQGLDPIIKDPEYGCALFIIHHTNKPARDSQGNRTGFDAGSAYEGAGAAETTNWTRAHLNLKATGKADGVFALVAAKRGRKLGWRDENGNLTTKKFIAYSDDIIYWRELAADELPSTLAAVPKVIEDPRKNAALLADELRGETLTSMQVREKAYELFGSNAGKRAFTELSNNPQGFGLELIQNGKTKFYRSVDSSFSDSFSDEET
jgi:hypothetical protein